MLYTRTEYTHVIVAAESADTFYTHTYIYIYCNSCIAYTTATTFGFGASGPPETTPIGNQSTAGALSRENSGATAAAAAVVLR